MSWSEEAQNIASGGDDCQYKIWDSQGSLVYASFVEDFSITSVEFGPKGQYLAVGGFNILKLCHFTGVSHTHLQSGRQNIEIKHKFTHSGPTAIQNSVHQQSGRFTVFVGQKMEHKLQLAVVRVGWFLLTSLNKKK